MREGCVRGIFVLLVFAVVPMSFAQGSGNGIPEFNRLVLNLIREYPTDGTHDYWWGGSYDGCTQDISLFGERVMDGEPGQQTYCCGLTLEVFTRAYERWMQENGGAETAALTAENWRGFQRLWFVPVANEAGPSAALVEYGLGREIDKVDARPGDFVQIWRRNGRGHSVIFLDWVRDEASGLITGFRYWSTQRSTDGISERVEYFGGPDDEDGVADEFTFWGRVEIPQSVATGGS